MDGCEVTGCEVEGADDERSARSADERSMRRPIARAAAKAVSHGHHPTAHFSTSA